jgi:pimeloyl-ACP methyl ester carboxylesterase
MFTDADPAVPPSRELLMLEGRAIFELLSFFTAYPLLELSPRGDGHPVLVLPGLAASDTSTQPLRTFLKSRGYRTHGWKLGPNLGPRPGVEDKMQARLAELAERYQCKVSLIGWSMGGIFAREMARRAPDQVRQVISLGSPFAGAPKASNAWQLYERVSGRKVEDWPHRELMRSPPPVPSTAIFTRSDGIVAWQGCLEQETSGTDNIEVEGSHCGLGHNPAVLYAIADRLSQDEGAWKPFDRSGGRGLVYPDWKRDDVPPSWQRARPGRSAARA